jgi:heme A synthase
MISVDLSVSSSDSTPRIHLPEGVHGYAVGLLIATLFLLFLGAMVKSTGSSLAVPDWPLSFGQLFPELKGGVFYEHIHRAVAGTVALLTLGLAVWLQCVPASPLLRQLVWLAVLLVVLQAVFGGITVLAKLPPVASVAHAATAQTFLAILTLLALLTAPAWRSVVSIPSATTADAAAVASGNALRRARLTFWLVFAQILIGVLFRHTGLLLHLHITFAVVVLVFVHIAFFAARKAIRLQPVLSGPDPQVSSPPETSPFSSSPILASAPEPSHTRAIRTSARWLLILTGIQVLLGLIVYLMFLSKAGIPLMSFTGAFIRSLHLWLGSLILLNSLLLWFWCARLAGTSRPVKSTARPGSQEVAA